MKVVLATSNPGKLKEFQELLKDAPFTLEPQSKWHVPDADETGLSFIENAILKARHAATLTGLPALADDSGLVVNVLNGEPGIYSARYAGNQSTAADNIQKLLTALQGKSETEREAHFHCVLAFLTHAKDPAPLICEGIWKGGILNALQGDQGFGYDPVFYVSSEKMSAAQLSPERKNILSHRGIALRLLLKQLPEKLCTLSPSNN